MSISTNAWAMRCFEQYLGDVVETQGRLAVALHDVQTIETTMECFTEKLVRQIARNAANSIEKALTLLGLDKDGQVALYESLATGGGGEFENWMGPEYRADHQ